MNDEHSYAWLYYKLMLGPHGWAFDWLLSNISEVTDDSRVKKWFFIRYMDDEGGLHIRLRLGVKASDAKAFEREAYPKLHEMIVQVPSLPLEEVSQLVTFPMPSFAQRGLPFGVKRAEYKPETEIYGGESGVAIVEELFQISSQIAIDVIREERNGTVSRKDLAPALMNAALNEFKIAKSPADFLADYMNYWATKFPFLDSYIAAFENKRAELKKSGIAIVLPDEQYHPLLSAQLAKWRMGLRKTHSAYKQMDGYSEILAERVLFYFIHLMNNRLGFNMVDEIYLSILLNEWKGAEVLA